MNDNPIKNYSPDSDNNTVRKFTFPNSDQVIAGMQGADSSGNNPNQSTAEGGTHNSGVTNASMQDVHQDSGHKSLKDMVKDHAHKDEMVSSAGNAVGDTEMPGEGSSGSTRPLVHIADALNAQNSGDESERNIRTYQSDISSAVKNDNVTMIKIALAEKKRQERTGSMDQIVEEKKNIKFTVIVSVVVLVFVGMVATALYVFIKSPSIPLGTPANTNPVQTIVYAEENMFINIDDRTSQDIIKLIQIEKGKEIDLGSLKYILFTTGFGTSSRPAITGEFFQATASRVSEALVRSLKDNFMLGIYAKNPYESFAIFNVDYYDGAFAEMLRWESTIERDLGGIFISDENLQRINNPVNVSTSTSDSENTTGTNSARQPDTRLVDSSFTRNVWVDKVIENKDSRALIDGEGRILMLYTFVDKETLVMATSDKTLREILFRLTAGRIVR